MYISYIISWIILNKNFFALLYIYYILINFVFFLNNFEHSTTVKNTSVPMYNMVNVVYNIFPRKLVPRYCYLHPIYTILRN